VKFSQKCHRRGGTTHPIPPEEKKIIIFKNIFQYLRMKHIILVYNNIYHIREGGQLICIDYILIIGSPDLGEQQ